MTVTDILAAHPKMNPVRDEYAEDYGQKALDKCDDSDVYTSECLGGDLGVRTESLSDYGESVRDEAEEEALANFDHVLTGYFAEVARFVPGGQYEDACEHAINEYDPGKFDEYIDAFERISEAHYAELNAMKEAA